MSARQKIMPVLTYTSMSVPVFTFDLNGKMQRPYTRAEISKMTKEPRERPDPAPTFREFDLQPRNGAMVEISKWLREQEALKSWQRQRVFAAQTKSTDELMREYLRQQIEKENARPPRRAALEAEQGEPYASVVAKQQRLAEMVRLGVERPARPAAAAGAADAVEVPRGTPASRRRPTARQVELLRREARRDQGEPIPAARSPRSGSDSDRGPPPVRRRLVPPGMLPGSIASGSDSDNSLGLPGAASTLLGLPTKRKFRPSAAEGPSAWESAAAGAVGSSARSVATRRTAASSAAAAAAPPSAAGAGAASGRAKLGPK